MSGSTMPEDWEERSEHWVSGLKDIIGFDDKDGRVKRYVKTIMYSERKYAHGQLSEPEEVE